MGTKRKQGSDANGTREPNNRSGGNSSKASWGVTFFKCELDNAEKALFKAWFAEDPDLYSLLDKACDNHVKLSLGWHDEHATAICTATFKRGEPIIRNTAFSSRHGTYYLALALTLWKLENITGFQREHRYDDTPDDEWG